MKSHKIRLNPSEDEEDDEKKAIQFHIFDAPTPQTHSDFKLIKCSIVVAEIALGASYVHEFIRTN